MDVNINLIIIIIAIIIIFVITFYYYRKYRIYRKNNKPKPRQRLECPDYWAVEGNNICRNIHKIGKCALSGENGNIVDFNDDIFQDNTTGNYAKCKWSKKCQAPWEGIDDLCA
jgi:hypothetical protein